MLPPLLVQIDSLKATFPTPGLKLLLKMLQLGLEFIVIALLFVADLRVRSLLFEILVTVLNLVKDLHIGRYLLLPILNMQVITISHGKAIPIVVHRLVLRIIVLLSIVILALCCLICLFTRWIRVRRVVSIDVILVVDLAVVNHVLVLVHERSALPQYLHVDLLSLHQFRVQSVDDGLAVLVLHQVIDILLIHGRIVLVDQEAELRVIHELTGIKLVHLKE